MVSTKSHTFIAAAVLAVLAGSILGSVSAAPLPGDQQAFGPGAVLSKAVKDIAGAVHTTYQDDHIPEGLRDVA